jgi:hypothetical protein
MHLFMALFWLVVGVFLYLNDPLPPLRIGKTEVPILYFVVALTLYNLWRWSVARAQRNARLAERERQRQQAERRHERDRPRDPTFDFEADEVPLPRDDAPPGKNGG